MKPGDLVRIVRASIGVPRGTLGLIVGDGSGGSDLRNVWMVATYGIVQRKRRVLEEDLEIVRG